MTIENSTYGELAPKLHECGINVIPLKNGKEPCIYDWQNYSQESMPKEVLDDLCKKFSGHGVGLPTGLYNDITVLDFDFDIENSEGKCVDLLKLTCEALGKEEIELPLAKIGEVGMSIFFKYNYNLENCNLPTLKDRHGTVYQGGELLNNRRQTVIPNSIHSIIISEKKKEFLKKYMIQKEYPLHYKWVGIYNEGLLGMLSLGQRPSDLHLITQNDITKIFNYFQAFILNNPSYKFIGKEAEAVVDKETGEIKYKKGGRNNTNIEELSEDDRRLADAYIHELILLRIISERKKAKEKKNHNKLFTDTSDFRSTDEIQNAITFVTNVTNSWMKKKELKISDKSTPKEEVDKLKKELAYQKKKFKPIQNPYGKDYLTNILYVDFIYEYFIEKYGYKKDLISGNLKLKEGSRWENEPYLTEKLIALASSYPFYVNHRLIEKHSNVYVNKLKGELLLDIEKWDGVDRIKILVDSFDYKNGYTNKIVSEMIKHWYVNMIKRIYNPDIQNEMLVFNGDQGDGKSTFARAMIKGLGHYFTQTTLDEKNGNDNLATLSSNIGVFLDELDNYNVNQLKVLKELIFAPDKEARILYTQSSKKFKLRNSFIGACNKDDFLKDFTGSRRYHLIDLCLHKDSNNKKIYPSYPLEDSFYNQLISQAYQLHSENFKMSEEVVEFIKNKQQMKTPDNPRLEALEDFYHGIKTINRIKEITVSKRCIEINNEDLLKLEGYTQLTSGEKWDYTDSIRKMYSNSDFPKIVIQQVLEALGYKGRKLDSNFKYIKSFLKPHEFTPKKTSRHKFFKYIESIKLIENILDDYNKDIPCSDDHAATFVSVENLPNVADNLLRLNKKNDDKF